MDYHVHLITVPNQEESLANAIGEAHKRYSRMVSFREGWRGYLFQGRFFSCPSEGLYAVAATRGMCFEISSAPSVQPSVGLQLVKRTVSTWPGRHRSPCCPISSPRRDP